MRLFGFLFICLFCAPAWADVIFLPKILCSADEPLRDKNGWCHSCDEGREINAENCEVCPNRIKNEQGMCVLKECPAGIPLRSAFGYCYSGDYSFRVNT